MHSFLESLGPFLKQFPDFKHPENVELIKKKSSVLPLIMDLSRFDEHKPNEAKSGPCIFLWNHRWEYDKNPDQFFKLMYYLKEKGLDFKIIVLGERFSHTPECFSKAKEYLSDHILHWGFVETFEKYASLLWQADVLPVTSYQDFFGGSTVEAMACNTFPLLPDRLAYSEHIPKEHREKHIYSCENDLFRKAEEAIKNIGEMRKNVYNSFVTKYDASTLIQTYDQVFL
jgi:glycosyltransferase involved in cell wall biosynthesis